MNRTLWSAINSRNVDRVNALLVAGAKVNYRDPKGMTPLMKAARDGNYEIVELLLCASADVNAVNDSDQTALFYVTVGTSSSHMNIVKLLLAAGATVDHVDAGGLTALKFAVMEGNVGMIDVLLTAGADVNHTDTISGDSVLMQTDRGCQLNAVELLLQAGADVNYVNPSSRDTPLLAADSVDIVEMLIAWGADLDAADVDGETALQFAASNGDTKLIEMLLVAGADPNHVAGNNWTPLVAARYGHAAVVIALLGANGAVDVADVDGNTALHHAAYAKKKRLHIS